VKAEKIISFLKRYDFTFFGIASIIFILGVFNLYSATHASSNLRLVSIYKTQIFKYLFSISAGFLISFIRPKTLFRFSYFIYFLNSVMLVIVLLLGHIGMGARRWLNLGFVKIQPSEFMKVSLVLALARWFAKNGADKDVGFKELIIPSIITIIPMVLIVLEPDLGTGLILILILLIMVFYRKLKWKTLGFIATFGLISGVVLYKFGLKDYQKKRVLTFLDPGADTKGSGYNAIQSKIAIGSGRFVGKGYSKSTQASLRYLPENHTDFVFSVFSEEHGFIGATILIILYLIFFQRFIWLSSNVDSMYESIITIGLMSIFFWHVIINMGMVMGLLPIVGLPLPFFSYGGSSLFTFGICCGLVTSVSNARKIF